MIINNSFNRDFIFRMESLLPKNKNFYHIDINRNDFSELEKIKDQVNTTDLNIVFDCAMEGYKSIVENIYYHLTKYNIPSERVFLIAGATDIQSIVNNYALSNNLIPFSAVWMREFEHFSSLNVKQVTPLTERKFLKSFLCLNRRWRLHRPVFVSQIIKNELLPYGFVSLDIPEIPNFGWDKIYDSIIKTHEDHPEISDYVRDNLLHLKKLTPLLLDTESHLLDRPWQLQPELDTFYEQTYLSVVTETNFYTNENKYFSNYGVICEGTRFLTEKTFKPMCYKHPFILVSTPHMIKLLQELGYKTFHPYIDESYDTIQDDGQRMLKIISEVKRIATFTKSELNTFLNQVQPIVEHNYSVLQKRYSELFNPKFTIDFRS